SGTMNRIVVWPSTLLTISRFLPLSSAPRALMVIGSGARATRYSGVAGRLASACRIPDFAAAATPATATSAIPIAIFHPDRRGGAAALGAVSRAPGGGTASLTWSFGVVAVAILGRLPPRGVAGPI